jgi:DNA-binding HxlR family transcriptional regulator
MKLAPLLEDRSRWSAIGQCPIEKAIAIVGSRPAMLLLREAHYGTHRFDDFVERVGIAPATAATHLRALTEAGLLERTTYQEPGERAREGYALTPAGVDLMPVVIGLFAWGVRYADGNDALEYAHVDCGAPVAVSVACADGHPVTTDEIEVRRVRR